MKNLREFTICFILPYLPHQRSSFRLPAPRRTYRKRAVVSNRNDDVQGSLFLSRPQCTYDETAVVGIKNDDIQGSSFLPTPRCIYVKRAVVNIKNDDEYCFLYSILAGFRVDLKTHPNRVSQYKRRLSELNYDGLEFPLKFHDVSKFEKQNPDISVNVFVYPISKPKDGRCPLCLFQFLLYAG